MADLKSLQKKSLLAFSWDFSGKIANHGITFIISVILVRILEPSDFGIIAMANVFTALSLTFVDFGFASGLIQKKNPTDLQYSTIFYINIVVGLLLTSILFFGAQYIAQFYANPKVGDVLQVLSFSFIITSFNIVHIAKFSKSLNLKVLTKANIYGAFISGSIGIYLAYLGFGVWSLVVKFLIDGICKTIYIWYKSKWYPKKMFNIYSVRDIWSFSNKIFLSGIIDTIFKQLDTLIIGKLYLSQELGYYHRAKSLNSLIVKYSSDSLNRVLFPVVSYLQDDLNNLRVIFKKTLSLISYSAFFLIGLFYLISDDLIVVLFSSKWIPSIILFKILLMRGYSVPLNSLFVNIIKGRGNSKLFLKLEILKKILYALAIIIGFQFGIIGFLYALVIMAVFGTLLNMAGVSSEIQFEVKNQVVVIIPHILIAFISSMFIIYIFSNFNFNPIINLIVYSIGYVLLFLLISVVFRVEAFNLIKKKLINLVKG